MSSEKSESRRRIEEFVGAFVSTRGGFAPGVPEKMRDGPLEQDGWGRWHPIDSRITDNDIAALEKSIGAPLPPLFREYLTYKCLLMTSFGVLSLPETRCDRPLDDIEGWFAIMETQPYWKANDYVPFGQDGDDYGVLAFDVRRRNSEGDYPIMYVAPEFMDKPGYRGKQKWESFAQLLDFVQADMLSYTK
jgi:hypothetical protein